MRSPSGKVHWLCPVCMDENIVGPLDIMGQKSGACGVCLQWWPWKQRLKESHSPSPPRRSTPQSKGEQNG